MNLTKDQLCDLVVEVAVELFGHAKFERRPLMDAVERRVRQVGAWTAADDALSQSTGAKSIGLASIDYAVSRLGGEGRLVNTRRGWWQIPPSGAGDEDKGGE